MSYNSCFMSLSPIRLSSLLLYPIMWKARTLMIYVLEVGLNEGFFRLGR